MSDLSDITATSMTTNEELLRSFLASYAPDLDTAPGSVLYELLIRPAAALYSEQETDLLGLTQTYSLTLLAASDDPDTALVQGLASNFNVYPRTGKTASGSLAIYTPAAGVSNVYIMSGTTFSVGSLTVQTLQTYVGVLDVEEAETEAAPTVVYRRMLRSGDYYMFTIPVVTTAPTTSTIAVGTVATPTRTHSQISRTIVAAPIVGGRAEESAKDLAARAANGPTAKVPSGQAQFDALLTEGEFDVYSTAIFGLGDQEMLRDQDNVFGISQGGRVDAYCRTSPLPETATIAVTGNRISGNTWRLVLDADDLDGFYQVISISQGSLPAVTDPTDYTLTFSVSSPGRYPYLVDVPSSFYSSYITVAIELEYAGITGDSATFSVVVQQQGGIRAIQDYLARLDIRNRAQDVLVKAPVPCFVEIAMGMNAISTVSDVDLEAVRQLIADTINAFPIGRGLVSAADIAYALHNAYPDYILDMPVVIRGTVVLPDGTLETFRSVDGELKAVENEALGVSARNTAFFCAPTDVAVSLNDKLV